MSRKFSFKFTKHFHNVHIRTTDLSRHTPQFAPLPVFSDRFRFAPFGAFYYWRKLVHTPVLYGADVLSIRKNFIYDRAPRQASENLPHPGSHRSRRIPLSHATVAWVSFHQISVCGCQTFTACVVRHLQVLHIFAARPSVCSRISVLAAFSAPCSGRFRAFLRLRSPPICRFALLNLGANRRLSDRRFSACLQHLDLAVFMSAF